MTRMAYTRLMACLAFGLWGASAAAQTVTLTLPAVARIVTSTSVDLTSYPMPIAAFSDGKMQTRTVEGAMSQTVWQITEPDQTTLDLLAPLRAQLQKAGYQVVLDCAATECGGFDFRYETPVVAEPDMHVDLGDYRFVSATKGDEAITLLVSRSSSTGFVQMTHVGAQAMPQTPLTPEPAAQTAAQTPAAQTIDAAAAPDDLGIDLTAGRAVAMDDLVFASGASALSEGVYPSLVALAEWLKAHPDLNVALVGHTDASGGLDVNIAVSRKRAESVRQRLIDRYDIPGARVDAQGVGYLSPRASNLTEPGREQNRRVEVMVTSTQNAP